LAPRVAVSKLEYNRPVECRMLLGLLKKIPIDVDLQDRKSFVPYM